MTERESQIANLIIKRIKKQDTEAEVILFGSHARGQSNEESDWDILILIDRQKQIVLLKTGIGLKCLNWS